MIDPSNCVCSRRQMLRSLVCGSVLFPGILQQLLANDPRGGLDPLAPNAPHFPGRAKRVIFLYMTGGVSHIDSFDPKPRLFEDADRPDVKAPNGRSYLRPLWEFKPGGQCGIQVSDLFPNVRDCMDDICLIRSMRGDHNDHFQATLGIHTDRKSV